LQPCASAGYHGCKRRSRGTHIIKVDGLLGMRCGREAAHRKLR
jgi:hypothetical protein